MKNITPRQLTIAAALIWAVTACSESTNQNDDDSSANTDTTASTSTGSPSLTLEILPEHPQFSCMGDFFSMFVDVFGVYVVATESAPLEYVKHTANVLAEYLDNDEDGIPDEPTVLSHLVENNYVVPVWSSSDREQFWQQARGTECEDNIGMAASMYYDGDAWAIGGIVSAGTWDTNLEEVWHVVSAGWYEVYPDYFGVAVSDSGVVTPSKITLAMDAARGGQFLTVPSEYPATAWYSYDDDTCDYHCQVHEYFYWILMANLDALDASITRKCEQSADEWNVCTKAALQETDVLAYELLNNYDFKLPLIIPDGNYRGLNP